MKRLCFGTLARVLKFCKLPSVTDVQLVGELTRTIDPSCEYGDSDGTAVSRLLACTQNLSNGQARRVGQRAKSDHGDFEQGYGSNRLSNVVQAAQTAIKAEVIRKIAERVLPLLYEDRKPVAALAIIEIIREDSTIVNAYRRFGGDKDKVNDMLAFKRKDL